MVGALGLAWLALFSRPGVRWLERIVPGATSTAPVLARVVDVSGHHVTKVSGATIENLTAPIERAIELRDGDHFETNAAGEATLVLNSQDELTVRPSSAISVELWNERDANSPIYVHVLAGDVVPKRSGVRGRAFVVRDGRLYLTNQRPGEKRPRLLITRDANAPSLDAANAPKAAPDDLADATDPARSTADGTEPAARKDDPATLANEYVEEVIASRQQQFQKCWLSRLKDKPGLKGVLTVQFEINRRGKVRDIKVTDSSLNDDQLGSCVATVVERLPFRSFTGPEISISYPITFE